MKKDNISIMVKKLEDYLEKTPKEEVIKEMDEINKKFEDSNSPTINEYLDFIYKNMKIKDLIIKFKEIETIVNFNVGEKLTEETATDIYKLINDLMSKIEKLPIYNVNNRDLYKELRTMGLTHNDCDQVLEWSKTLYN